jgi:hypothetical protein
MRIYSTPLTRRLSEVEFKSPTALRKRSSDPEGDHPELQNRLKHTISMKEALIKRGSQRRRKNL